MSSTIELEKHINDTLPTLKGSEAHSYFQAFLRVIEKGIQDGSLKETILEILHREASPRFFVMTATKSGSTTNSFLSQNPGSEIYHVLSMCLRLNRQLQIEPAFNIEVNPGVRLVRRVYFEDALAGTLLHDFRKCGGVSDFDDSTSDPYHGSRGATIFETYAQKNRLDPMRIRRIAAIIRYHDGRFSPLLRDKYYGSVRPLQEILEEETQDKIATLLVYQVHSLDMLTSNGLLPAPSAEERAIVIEYLNSTDEYLRCAD